MLGGLKAWRLGGEEGETVGGEEVEKLENLKAKKVFRFWGYQKISLPGFGVLASCLKAPWLPNLHAFRHFRLPNRSIFRQLSSPLLPFCLNPQTSSLSPIFPCFPASWLPSFQASQPPSFPASRGHRYQKTTGKNDHSPAQPYTGMLFLEPETSHQDRKYHA